jgi:hypothetical protein
LNFPDCSGQQIGERLFDQISRRAPHNGLSNVAIIAMRREHEHLGAGRRLQNSPGGFQTIEQWSVTGTETVERLTLRQPLSHRKVGLYPIENGRLRE